MTEEPVSINRKQFLEQLAVKREAEKRAEREAQEAREKESARRDWLAEGGAEDAFEKEWPEIRNAMLVGEVLARQGEAREESRRRTRAAF